MIGCNLGHLHKIYNKGRYYLPDEDKIPFIKFASININVSHC